MASAAVSIAVWKQDQVLLVRRGRPPFAGLWTFPGGKVEMGETSHQAIIRELFEETGLAVANPVFLRLLGTSATRADYVLAVYAAHFAGGNPVAMHDAAEIGWFAQDELEGLETTPGLAGIAAETRGALTQV